jgi:outer membrane murein-binding lipoprotein Lpp
LRDGRAASPAIAILAPVSPAASPRYGRGMDDPAATDISRLEDHIEALRDSIARCRKIALAAKLTIGAGVVWLLLSLLWLVPFVVSLVIAAIAAVIGGIVLAGSNSTTWKQTEALLRNSEALRAELIGGIEMRVVEESRTLH